MVQLIMTVSFMLWKAVGRMVKRSIASQLTEKFRRLIGQLISVSCSTEHFTFEVLIPPPSLSRSHKAVNRGGMG